MEIKVKKKTKKRKLKEEIIKGTQDELNG